MRILPAVCFVALLALRSVPVYGQTPDDALFDAPEAGVAAEPAAPAVDVAGKFLGTELKTSLFGELSTRATATWTEDDPVLSQSLSLDLGLTARPDENLRIGAKSSWSFDPGTETASFHVSEAFADFQGGESAYFRVGKQFLSWGKGLYYSPADVLSLSVIDPADTGASREGPTAFKASLEAGALGTYQAVISTEAVMVGSDVTFSALATWVVAGTELAAGGFYQASKDKSPRLFATTVFRLLNLDWYTESVLLWGNDQNRVADNGLGGLVVETNDGNLLTQQTVGFSYSKDDSEKRFALSASGQYYYNGTGDGTHYVAGSLGLSKLGGSTFSVSCSGLDSLSEDSWQLSPRLGWVASPDLTFAAGGTWYHGASKSEYAPLGALSSWQAEAKLYSHLTVTGTGPLPGSEDEIDPQLKVTFSGFAF